MRAARTGGLAPRKDGADRQTDADSYTTGGIQQLSGPTEPTHVRLWRRNATLNHKPPHIWRDSWSLVGQSSILDVLEDQDGTRPTYKSLAV